MKQNKNIFYYLMLSTIAALIILILTFLNTSTINTININDKLIITGIFITSSIYGISIAIYPNWYKKTRKKQEKNQKQNKKTTREQKGHHPDCTYFKSHIFNTKNKTHCAGCLGLTIGATISIILTILYITNLVEQTNKTYHILIIIGLTIISLSFVEITLSIRSSTIHTISNTLLIISFLIITISILEITKNIFYGLIAILLSFLWLETRIQLSKWQHHRICQDCTENCKTY